MIRFSDVCFAYDETPVLDRLSFECPPGGVVWLSGANGAGKSTAIHIGLGLLTPQSGQVTPGLTASAVFQEDRLCEHLSALANVRLGLARRATNDQIRTELSSAGLPLPEIVRPVGSLSGGQRRRVGLVRALMRQSDLLCLDEPYTGIDEDSIDQLVAYTLARIGARPVLMACHDPVVAARFNPEVVLL